MKASQQVIISVRDHLETLQRCDGYYECPVDDDGLPTGLVVGYAGRYDDEKSGKSLQKVGLVYYNFAKAEKYPHVLQHFTSVLATKIVETCLPYDIMLGAPMGGITTALSLATHLNCQFGFAEKKVDAVATSETRERSHLVMDRHMVEPGDNVWIVEDVCNNFSTTAELYQLVRKAGAEVAGIACLLDRSDATTNRVFRLADGKEWILPELARPAMLRIPTKQYRQDDPMVAEAIVEGRVAWKPKDEWARLKQTT